jgi:uncharacterized membrane protein YgcG
MYYPKSQIISNLYTKGGELIVSGSRIPYSGSYYQTANGSYFSNKSPQDKPSFKLIPITKNEYATSSLVDPGSEFQAKNEPNSYYLIRGIYSSPPGQQSIAPSAPRQAKPMPTEKDYTLGQFVRYFAYSYNSKSTLEINKKDYDKLINKDKNIQFELYDPITLKWKLTGKKEEVYKTNFNLVKLKQNKENIPNFSSYFKDRYTQYFRFGKEENLYSDGTELRYTKSKKKYIGFYHIHESKGPMVGAQHTTAPHEYLEFIPTGSIANPLPVSPQSGSYVEPTSSMEITLGGPIVTGGGGGGSTSYSGGGSTGGGGGY